MTSRLGIQLATPLAPWACECYVRRWRVTWSVEVPEDKLPSAVECSPPCRQVAAFKCILLSESRNRLVAFLLLNSASWLKLAGPFLDSAPALVG